MSAALFLDFRSNLIVLTRVQRIHCFLTFIKNDLFKKIVIISLFIIESASQVFFDTNIYTTHCHLVISRLGVKQFFNMAIRASALIALSKASDAKNGLLKKVVMNF